MRLILLFLATLLVMPVQAQYWTHYENDAFGYEIDIPPGYENYMDSADGNGAVFMLVGMQQELTVWGEALEADSGDFTDAAQRALDSDIADGWAITYQVATPDWASWSGVKDGQVLYRRMIILCDRQSHASFRSVYPSQDLPGMHPVLEGLVRSFVPTAC